MQWEPEDYIEEIRCIIRDISDKYEGHKGVLACDILRTDKPDARGTKSTKELNRIINGDKKFYDIDLLYRVASYLNKTVGTLLVEIELKIASKKPPII